MTAAVQLLDGARVRRLAIIDCDYHYGDGTQAIIDTLKLGDRVLHMSFGARYSTPAQAEAYLDAMYGLRGVFESFRPDLIIYQAGADTHVDDPRGGLLTTVQMQERDRAMFSIASELSIPVTWALAGGYQVEADGAIPRVVALHLNTFEEALKVWQAI
jgi:acetoin utilization deacetylase AcuC-like enzyme